ncbi:conserved hypothetical protein [Vibrio phage 242E40-1]|nr:conserved hypothetical protein [Vibrio phage 242E40-1]
MMKVYVALAGYDYEGYEVVGVHSSRELAESCIDNLKNRPKVYFDNYKIQECEIDGE